MSHYKKYKTAFKRELLQALVDSIKKILLTVPTESDDDKLLYATLADISFTCEKKLLVPKTKYPLTLSASEAFALRILKTDYLISNADYLGNKLFVESNKIHQHYS
jgi:hypothetical protein